MLTAYLNGGCVGIVQAALSWWRQLRFASPADLETGCCGCAGWRESGVFSLFFACIVHPKIYFELLASTRPVPQQPAPAPSAFSSSQAAFHEARTRGAFEIQFLLKSFFIYYLVPFCG